MKTYPMPTKCPVSNEPLHVTRLECDASGVVIEGRFEPNEFALLPPEQVEFLRIFLRVRGNLKEVERMMGVSYPTVRLRFETLLSALDYEPLEDIKAERSEVIAMLEKGEISADEAAARLKAIKERV